MSRSHRGPAQGWTRHVQCCGIILTLLSVACSDPTAPPAGARPAPGAGANTTIIVAPTGIASAPGTMRAPTSLERAVATAPEGATIRLQPGEYATGGLVVTRPMTIIGPASGGVILRGSATMAATRWEAVGTRWRTPFIAPEPLPVRAAALSLHPAALTAAALADGDLTPAAGGATHAEAVVAPVDAGHLVAVDGRSLTPAASLEDVHAGTYFIDPVGKWLYVGENPAVHTVTSSAMSTGMSIYSSGVRVSGLRFDHFSYIGLFVSGSNVMIDHNDISYNGLIGLDINGNSNVTVSNNTIQGNAQVGIEGSHTSHVTIANNNISNNNTGNFDVSAAAGGLKFTDASYITVSQNWVSGNQSNAVWFDVNSSNITVVRNTVLHNKCYGIYFELANSEIIAGNVVHDNASGIGVHFSANAKVYNNTVVNNGTNLDISASYNRSPWDTYHAVIVNNILWNANRVLSNLYRYNGCNSWVYSEVDYNAYYWPSGSPARYMVNWCNSWYSWIGSFHSGTGNEVHGLQYSGGSDPFFVNVWGGDYRLHSGSPAIRRGQPLPSDVAAALGWSAWTPVSMGAMQ